MPKRTMFTNITPLPLQVSREVAVAMLHNHDEMIELNPLVIEHHPIKTPRDAPADEFLDCVWQELTDKIHYLPGGLVKGKVSYKACFHDTPTGLQTHVYAPMGLDIREKWSVGGNLPGEPPEPRELGLNTPMEGLYLREDCDMKCSIVLTGFVRKNLDNAHKVLVERILKKAVRVEEHLRSISPTTSGTNISTTGSSGFQPGSHMSRSQFVTSPLGSPRQEGFTTPIVSLGHGQYFDSGMIHPAFRGDVLAGSSHGESVQNPPPYYLLNGQQHGFPSDAKLNSYRNEEQQHHPVQLQGQNNPQTPNPPSAVKKEFTVELPGSMPERTTYTRPPRERLHRQHERPISELSAADTLLPSGARQLSHGEVGSYRDDVSELSQSSDTPHQGKSRSSSRRPSDIEVPPSPPPKPSFQQYQAQRSKRV